MEEDLRGESRRLLFHVGKPGDRRRQAARHQPKLHQRYHLALVAGCRSEWLLRFRHILFEQSERYRFLAYGVQPRDIEGEHRTIMQATLARDAEAAVKALSDHLTLTAEIIFQSFVSGVRPRCRIRAARGASRRARAWSVG